jgi:hypothetical protein
MIIFRKSVFLTIFPNATHGPVKLNFFRLRGQETEINQELPISYSSLLIPNWLVKSGLNISFYLRDHGQIRQIIVNSQSNKKDPTFQTVDFYEYVDKFLKPLILDFFVWLIIKKVYRDNMVWNEMSTESRVSKLWIEISSNIFQQPHKITIPKNQFFKLYSAASNYAHIYQ